MGDNHDGNESGIATTTEVAEGLLAPATASDLIRANSLALLRGNRSRVLCGPEALVKVNTSIGCNRPADWDLELRKLDQLANCGYGPDIMMDLSTVRLARPLYAEIRELTGAPVGTLPHYTAFKPRDGLDKSRLLEEIERHATEGVAWVTLHLAVTSELYELARRTRRTPTTARGGGIAIRDMLINNRSESLLAELFPEILRILKRFGTALSLGTTFRPANTLDALDAAHKTELRLQRRFIDESQAQGVPVMLEAVGHMRLSDVPIFTNLVRSGIGHSGPVVTLGPIPTDASVGEDHIANAIGSSVLALAGGTDVINSITREEHTGSVPDLESILEGLRAARIAAHAVNISKFPQLDSAAEDSVVDARNKNYTCVVDGGLFSKSATTRHAMGCTRCGNECPLVVNFVIDRERGRDRLV
ncbi:phosphomethylpyrimidine synthase ThiC [Cellulomonas marina]|uniref:Phosphomethylpyrimidine synthase n=1 Tax=Cellulomonas marina TaxID=988821 RepID=A0A1I1AWC7_9CELL|nr:phosphomethylpyrimidine synthase ThiC [Cellulomonas marina]GIG30798.1 phosphomethylpyrimidine synthase [Cellulomonas marina]SFB42385.1 phosphomethylpyrimidine synthase [Cellulomonas marina]